MTERAPVRESFFSSPNVLSKIWVKYFLRLDKSAGVSDDAALMAATAPGAKDDSGRISDIEKISLLREQPRDYEARLSAVERKIILFAEGRDVGRQIEDLSLLEAIGESENPTWESRIKALEDVPEPWPIGSIFVSTVSTNPATLLGYGTWAAFGTGKTLVGIDAGDADFDTVEETGGAKTAAIDSHAGAAVADHTVVADKQGAAAGDVVTTGNHVVTQPNDHADINVVQPYVVVYMFQRTA